MRELIRRYVPRPIRLRLRRSIAAPLDLLDRLRGAPPGLTPPRGTMLVRRGNYSDSGQVYLPLFIKLGELRPHERVLDVGCGVGHMAIALVDYLDERGSYEGFDIVKQGVTWCEKHITSRYPAFRFQHLDVKNAEYNPGGRTPAEALRFPYDAGSFDFVLLTSVFTHVRIETMSHYLSEIRRVLKVGGRCFASVFLVDDASGESGPGLDLFRYTVGGSRTIDDRIPEKALAHAEADARGAFAANHLAIRTPIHYGEWRQYANLMGSQDIIVATRES